MYTDNFIDICKMVVLCTLGGTLVFTLIPLVYFFELNELVVISGCVGFFCGAVYPPEIKPEIFMDPIRYQAIAGTIAGTIVAYVITTLFPSLTPSLTKFIIALLIGAGVGFFLGITTRFWINSVNLYI